VKVERMDLKFLRRLGAKDEANVKFRPILLGVFNMNQRFAILESARLLNKNVKYENVRIVPDLTERQRKEEERMRVECLELNAKLEQSVAVHSEWRLVALKGEKRQHFGKKIRKNGDNSIPEREPEKPPQQPTQTTEQSTSRPQKRKETSPIQEKIKDTKKQKKTTLPKRKAPAPTPAPATRSRYYTARSDEEEEGEG